MSTSSDPFEETLEEIRLHPARHVFSIIGLLLSAAIIVILFVGIAFYVRSLLSTNQMAAVVSATLVDLTNKDRKNEDLRQLSINPLLVAAAQAKADHMAENGYFAHISPDGRDPWSFMTEVGYEFSSAGENLAVNFSDSSNVEKAWMNSPGHRSNILSGRFTEIGIATAVGEYKGKQTTFVVQMFGTPRPPVILMAGEPQFEVLEEEEVVVAPPVDVPIEKTEMSITIGEVTPQIAGSVSTAPNYANVFEALLASPQTLLRIMYVLCGIFVVVALILTTRLEFRRHHVKHVLAAIFLIVLMTGLFIVADHMVFIEPIVNGVTSR